MITVSTQLHGYRQGHQLLDSAITLSKSDQSAIDRLSDVAGPLRPGEVFEPYLSAYPLPSGRFFILARTWQDLTVPRAGCVRTMSVVIPIDEWQQACGIQPFLDLLDHQTFPTSAISVEVSNSLTSSLPPAPEFRAGELLEALFLEDSKPVALFDAPLPELIAARLLTALWPSLRRRFSVSTFALSPRKIEGRNFDLVFAPKDARTRFADWPGRRIDARATTVARHRWTGKLVERVFQSPRPWLLAEHDIRLIGEEESGTPAALRVVLLWDELLAKLEHSPSAALGLVDLANSRIHSGFAGLHDLQPVLALAVQRAAQNMAPDEAWEFLGALVRKISRTAFAPALGSVTNAVGLLVARSPDGALELLERAVEGQDAIEALLPTIGDGLAAHYGDAIAKALGKSPAPTFRKLILSSKKLARVSIATPFLVDRLVEMMPILEPREMSWLSEALLPEIVDDQHAALARSLFASLNVEGVIAELLYLNRVDRLKAKGLLTLLIERARQLAAIDDLRNTALTLAPSNDRDQFLRMTILPVADDARWLVLHIRQDREIANTLLDELVRQANAHEFRDLFSDVSLAPQLLEIFAGKRDILLRALAEGQLPLSIRVPVGLNLLTQYPGQEERGLAEGLLNDCLRSQFGGDELAALSALFAFLNPGLDSGWVIQAGLEVSLTTALINRNIVAFNTAPKEIRLQILWRIEDVARQLAQRWRLDFNEEAANACAVLLWDAQADNFAGALRGAGQLLPALFRSTQAPLSPVVAVAFPLIYRELAKADDVPDLFKFVPFIDWDRCKAARHELVDAFMSSETWRPADLALTAWRSFDVDKILRRIKKCHGGKLYLKRVAADAEFLSDDCQYVIRNSLAAIGVGNAE